MEQVRHTYLWIGFHCFGRVDGSPRGSARRRVLPLCHRAPRCGSSNGLECVAFLETRSANRCYVRNTRAGVSGNGGAVEGGFVQLPLRRLDPRTGSFDAPDPLTGLDHDPRRAEGYEGPLVAQIRPLVGPYVIARNNAVSLADPTGGISDLWWLIPSAVTWPTQNTVASIYASRVYPFVPVPGLLLWLLPNLFDLLQVSTGSATEILSAALPISTFSVARIIRVSGFARGGLLDALRPDAAWTYQFLGELNRPAVSGSSISALVSGAGRGF